MAQRVAGFIRAVMMPRILRSVAEGIVGGEREAKVNFVAVQATNRLSHCGRGSSLLASTAKMGLLDRDLIAIWFGGYETGLDSVPGVEFGVTLHLRVIELG